MICNAEEFLNLRESKKEHEYQRAAREPAPLAVWKEVIKKYPHMRRWVAYNKTVPNEILQVLAQDIDKEVREMVAMRRSAGEDILYKLSKDKEEIVRRSVLFNPRVTKKVLESLLDDPEDGIQKIALMKLSQWSVKSI